MIVFTTNCRITAEIVADERGKAGVPHTVFPLHGTSLYVVRAGDIIIADDRSECRETEAVAEEAGVLDALEMGDQS